MKEIFMNLQSDFAFKRLFGTEQWKGIVIKFLNTLFDGEFRVLDVKFQNK